MSETTDAADSIEVTNNGLVDALAFGWRLLSLALVAVLALAWTGFWGNVVYLNVTNGDIFGGLVTAVLLLGTLVAPFVTGRQ